MGIPHLGVFVGDAQQLELRSGDGTRELPTRWVMTTLFYRTIGLEGGSRQSARVFDSPPRDCTGLGFISSHGLREYEVKK